jgi:GAF domain-containing protein
MIVHREFTLHAGLAPLLETLPQRGALPARPDHAAVLPITDGQELLGCLVLYLGAGQPLTEDMRRFLDMLAKRISVSATMVLSYQAKERSAFSPFRSADEG